MQGSNSDKLSFVCFGGIDWWYHSRAHIDPQLMIRFAKRGTTLFINSIVMTRINFNEGRRFFQKLIRKTKSIFKGLKKTEKGFWVYSPISLPVHHVRWAKPLNDLFLRFQVRRVTWKLGIYNPVILVACPTACDIAMKMKRNKLIYQRTDRFEEAEGVDVHTIVKYDQKLKANADITIFVNRALYDEESGQCKRAFFLDHGVDFELFASAQKNSTTPPDMANIPKPIIGYFGAISGHSVDIALAEKIADILSEMSFVYIGTASSDCSGLNSRKNVWMLGQKNYDDIPQYGKCFDVAILPWVKNKWTEAANPIKVKEYLALGKPFVTTPVFTQVQEYLDVAYVANTSEEFARCIVRALEEDSHERIDARRKKVEQNTWDSKAQFVLQELFRSSEFSAKGD